MLICWCEILIKNDSSTDAKADFDKGECNKPENPGDHDQKNEAMVSFQQSKDDRKRGKNSDEKI